MEEQEIESLEIKESKELKEKLLDMTSFNFKEIVKGEEYITALRILMALDGHQYIRAVLILEYCLEAIKRTQIQIKNKN